MTSLAVVIVSWNVCDLLQRCLTSLLDELETVSAQSRVIVVDNASSDGSVEMVRERFPQVEMIARTDNAGFAGGNNIGLRVLGIGPHPPVPFPTDAIAGRGGEGFVLLLNPDTEVQHGAITSLLDAIQRQPDAAVVTSSLKYGDGAFQHSAFRFPGLAQLTIDLFPVPARMYESRLNGRYPRQKYAAGEVFEIDHPLGAVMLLRATAIEQVGVFDEDFELYCEEIDWCARFKEHGWRNYCVPSATVVHHSGKSTSQVKAESFVKLWAARRLLYDKHPDFAPLGLVKRMVRIAMRRRLNSATEEMREAYRQIVEIWG